MPEGDTIFRAARRLSRVLAGKELVRFDSKLPLLQDTELGTARVLAVDAVGKYLVVRFEGDRNLVTHMKMNGAWQVYARGQKWKRGASHAQVTLETAEHVAVCFDAPVVRLVTNKGAQRALASLGPDLLAPEPDMAEAARRIRDAPFFEISHALLSQRLVAGIGNVIKSEALFAVKLDPRAQVKDLPDEAIARALAESRRILLLNVTVVRGRRRTRGGKHPLWVYGRAGEPCFTCKTPILRIYQGPLGAKRSTYFCPSCQGT